MPITRRDFLKMLGIGAAGYYFGAMGGLDLASKISSSLNGVIREASGQAQSPWIAGPNTTVVAIHACLLHTGKILYVAGSGWHGNRMNGPFEARLLDLDTNMETNYTLPEDLFCCGHAQLPNGNILLAGGTLKYDTDPTTCNGKWWGHYVAYEFDVASSSFVKVTSMAHGRWYPTLVTLKDGKVFTIGGFDEYGTKNALVEIYDPNTKSWSISYDPSRNGIYCVGSDSINTCPGAGQPCYGGTKKAVAPSMSLYPRSFLMPTGYVVTAGMYKSIRIWNPSTGVWTLPTSTSSIRDYGTAVLLPLNNTATERGKLLIAGGSPSGAPTSPALSTVEIVDFDAGTATHPVVRTTASLSYARKYQVPVVLPTGKVVLFGGSSMGLTNPVYVPEMFDPVTETWTSLEPASIARVYHSTALLLPDGRVWVAGSTSAKGKWENRTEIYRPSYYFATRPTITNVTAVGNYGGTIDIATPDYIDIDAVSLVRLPTTTHHYNVDTRLIWLQILNRSCDGITVSAPLNGNIAPPGYYMIHVLKQGIPSVAKIIKIPGP